MLKKNITICVSICFLILGFLGYIFFSREKFALQYDSIYKVGFTQESVGNKKLYVFYPTLDTKKQKIFADNKVFYGFYAQENAMLEKEKYPLLFLYHGYEGNWKNLSWLASKFTAQGYIVVTQDIEGFSSLDYSLKNFLTLQSTLDAEKRNIENFISTSSFAPYIDHDQVNVGGASFGGLLALLINGATFDYKKVAQYCSHDIQSPTCVFLDDILFSMKTKDEIVSGKSNIQIKNTFAITPGLGEGISLKFGGKVVIFLAQNDKNIRNQVWENLSSDMLKIIDRTTHFSFLQVCTKQGKAILAEQGITNICEESFEIRKHYHDRVFLEIQNFLKN